MNRKQKLINEIVNIVASRLTESQEQVDAILDKINAYGIDSLTQNERIFLNQDIQTAFEAGLQEAGRSINSRFTVYTTQLNVRGAGWQISTRPGYSVMREFDKLSGKTGHEILAYILNEAEAFLEEEGKDWNAEDFSEYGQYINIEPGDAYGEITVGEDTEDEHEVMPVLVIGIGDNYDLFLA